MHEIRTEIEIASTPEVLWSILTEFDVYPSWNPFIRSIDGQCVQGGRLAVSVQPVGGREMTFRPTVLVAVTNRELRWLGHWVVPRIFDGEHYFLIASAGADRVRFVQGEIFRGILVKLMKSNLEVGVRSGFVAMNVALRDRAEARSRT